jgi:predicted Fe-S protein YdhL (DUF1289 family)
VHGRDAIDDMSKPLRSTPCVGICSTTYGDLVCRGCNRFAHEIVAWNGYSDDQRSRVWQRLLSLRDAATGLFIAIDDVSVLRAAGTAARLALLPDMSLLTLCYELLRRKARDLERLSDIGLRPLHVDHVEPVAVRNAIDTEFRIRSVAYYEHSFHTPVDS